MINYLTSSNDKFIHDHQLKFDPQQYPKLGSGERKTTMTREQTINKETDEWIDEEIDVSDLPPSILFMAIVNAYSAGFQLFIPLDISFPKFSVAIAQELQSLLLNPITTSTPFCNSKYIKHELVLDLVHLNATGKIKSSKAWNQSMYKAGHIWIVDNLVLDSIQGIVGYCRNNLKYHK